VGTLFEKIQTAKAPEAFTTRYLADVIGLKSTGDRSLINMMKKLGFLDATGRPTELYNLLKNKDVAATAIADGIRRAYSPLFDANEKANELQSEQLKGLIAQVSGADESLVKQIAYTFNALVKQGDFSKPANRPLAKDRETDSSASSSDDPEKPETTPPLAPPSGFRSDFHFNIQIHLPANGTEETYLNIFNALRRTFS
jgi:hypothetical protein